MVEWLQKNSGEKLLSANPSKDLMDLLVEKTRATGHILTFKELSNDPEMFRLYFYSKYYISFEHAATLAWEKAKQPAPIAKSTPKPIPEPAPKPMLTSPIVKEVKRSVVVNPSATNGGINLRPQKPLLKKELNGMENRSKPYTKEEIIHLLVDYYQRSGGKIPTQSTANPWHNLPSYYTIKKFLGSNAGWEKIILDEINRASNAISEMSTTKGQEPESDPAVIPEVKTGEDFLPEPTTEVEPEVKEPASEVAPEDTLEPEPEPSEPKELLEEVQIKDVKVDASCEGKDDESVTIELKITIPGREKPIIISLTV